MKHDRTKMPPDELMCKVVAKWKGWDFIHLLNHEDCDGKYWDDDIVYGPYSCPLFHQYKKDAAHDLTGFVFDPRTDTDAALELFHSLVQEVDCGYWCSSRAWVFELNGERNEDGYPYGCRVYDIPISGEPFRRGVCWLACDVLGVDDDTE